MLQVVRIYGGYAVVLAEDARIPDADLIAGCVLAAFATEAQAHRFAEWLMLLRSAYHATAA